MTHPKEGEEIPSSVRSAIEAQARREALENYSLSLELARRNSDAKLALHTQFQIKAYANALVTERTGNYLREAKVREALAILSETNYDNFRHLLPDVGEVFTVTHGINNCRLQLFQHRGDHLGGLGQVGAIAVRVLNEEDLPEAPVMFIPHAMFYSYFQANKALELLLEAASLTPNTTTTDEAAH